MASTETTPTPPRFGFCIPTFAWPGPALFRAPGWTDLDPARVVEAAVRAEELGFDSVWVPDHVIIGADGAVLDGWTTLSVIAGATRRVSLCLIQQSTLFRHAPQFAKMAATLDHLSGGRLIVFSNLGRAEAEHRAYGFPWYPAFADRLERHAETLDVLRALWTAQGPVSHRGTYFTLQDAIARPAPLQMPHPPLWFAGSEPELLTLAAKHGDGWNTSPVSQEEFRRLHRLLADALETVGRTVSEFTVSLEIQVLIRPTLDALRETLRRFLSQKARSVEQRAPLIDPERDPFLRGETDALPTALTNRCLIGTPEQVLDQINGYRAAGVDMFGCWFLDFPDPASAVLFSELTGITTAAKS